MTKKTADDFPDEPVQEFPDDPPEALQSVVSIEDPIVQDPVTVQNITYQTDDTPRQATITVRPESVRRLRDALKGNGYGNTDVYRALDDLYRMVKPESQEWPYPEANQ